ncbi:hypothetical protein PLESTB_000317600 [Pleodorina starrii]|uniref:Sulfotransferase domain-containing protein n=1 Tax=Pleodorina starrii TaxID=330485 RepID=A0A9W6BDP2_9CHLO|nr:hypothetical protein PLESTM_001739300 [Pleodorina starrii]GLC49870.1 hypothetical protein PLESTB_000317600 [Pleodorina starrii]GLC68260.1 hypothetical protein PLESTF_000667800 [Pleodorina starrii]
MRDARRQQSSWRTILRFNSLRALVFAIIGASTFRAHGSFPQTLNTASSALSPLRDAQSEPHELPASAYGDTGRAASRGLLAAVRGRVGRSSGAQLTRPSPGGTLFSWGLKEWRLGRVGGDNSIPMPALVNLTVISVAASRHSAVVSSEGVVWTMGHNDSKGGGGHGSPPLAASGQLGRGGSKEPGPVEGPLVGKFVVQVVTGRYHTLALTDQGELYSWGLNDWGQLGRGAAGAYDESRCTSGPSCRSGVPGLVSLPGGARVVGAAAGRYVSMAVDESGRLYSWGHDGCSNGGKLPERDQAHKPRRVGGELAGKRVVAFDAGYVFWLAATAEGEVYTCNSQDDGYAGTLSHRRPPNNAGELGRDGDPLLPGRVAGALTGQKVEVVAAGREHAVVATADGEVYTWGSRDLLMGRTGSAREPGQALGALAGDNIRFVSAGEYHSGAASEKALYGWGSNGYFCTGVGRGNPVQKLKPGSDRGDVYQPALAQGVIARGGWQVQALVGGFQHGLAIAANKGGSWGDKMHHLHRQGGQAGRAGVARNRDANTVRWTASGLTNNGTGSDTTVTPTTLSLSSSSSSSSTFAAATTGTAATGSTTTPRQQLTAGAKAAPSADYHTRYLGPQLHPALRNASEVWGQHVRSARFELIRAQSPDIWQVLPPSYDPRFKNPCWTDTAGLFRCIPYYHILGVSKCGTTDLYHRLSKHPDLFKSRNKGPHWWDECIHPPRGPCTAPPNGDFDGYVNLFADAAEKILRLPEGITGEASSNTFTSAAGVYLRGPSSDRDTTVTMPELMHEASPFLRNIVIFRNPVDRYFSAFYYYRRWDKTQAPPGPEAFHDTAKQEMAIWRDCVEQRGLKYCVRHYHPQQLVKGMYSEFITDWLNQFPRDQLLFLRNEDYSAATFAHMEAVFQFLGVRRPNETEWLKIMGMETRNKNSDKYKKMLPETRAMLEEFYRPFNERLAQVLGDDRWLWRDSSSSVAT